MHDVWSAKWERDGGRDDVGENNKRRRWGKGCVRGRW